MFASEEHARAFYAQAQEAERQRTAQFEQQRQQQMQMLQAQQAEATRRAYVAANNEALIAAGTAKYPDFEKVVNNPQFPTSRRPIQPFCRRSTDQRSEQK